MPIAAVPKYLGQDFENASPGMRFGALLPIWTTREDQEREVRRRSEAKSREGAETLELLRQGMDTAILEMTKRQTHPLPKLWEKNDAAARSAWKSIIGLSKDDRALMQHLFDRQSVLRDGLSESDHLTLYALSTSPFTNGLGNEHPLENGFAFLNPYGLPYLPGSGVKGVLRQAARELASGEWGDAHGWTGEDIRDYTVTIDKTSVPLSLIDVLFGRMTEDGDSEHVRGVLTFWDVIPQIHGDSLAVEIMTPHQGNYYQGKANPHESGQPTPICFLTVPPKSGFTFHVQCDLYRLNKLAPKLAKDGFWKDLLSAAFEHAFAWLGFGAKTAVGYGAMERDLPAEQAELEQFQEEERKAVLEAMSPNQRQIHALREEITSRLEAKRKLPISDNLWGTMKKLASTAAESADWTAEERAELAEVLEKFALQLMDIDPKKLRKELKLSILR